MYYIALSHNAMVANQGFKTALEYLVIYIFKCLKAGQDWSLKIIIEYMRHFSNMW